VDYGVRSRTHFSRANNNYHCHKCYAHPILCKLQHNCPTESTPHFSPFFVSHSSWSSSRGLEPLLLLHSHIQRCLWYSIFLYPQFPSPPLFLHFTEDSSKSYNLHIPLTIIIISNPITSRSLATALERIIVSTTIYSAPFLPTSKVPNKLEHTYPSSWSQLARLLPCTRDVAGHPLGLFVVFLNPSRRKTR
jgi:hypothetical protein